MSQQRKQVLAKRQLTAAQFTARYRAEKVLQRRRYCAAFALWRTCPHKRCRRQHACMDASPCLQRAITALPRDTQWRVRQGLLAATPHNLGAPERAARQCMPVDLYIDTAARAVADYLARFKPAPRREGKG